MAATVLLSVNLAADEYDGDALANLGLNGLPGPQGVDVSALHSKGANQAVALGMVDSTESHLVSVAFLNDAWGGGPTLDRNLYVVSYSLGSVTIPVGLELPVNGQVVIETQAQAVLPYLTPAALASLTAAVAAIQANDGTIAAQLASFQAEVAAAPVPVPSPAPTPTPSPSPAPSPVPAQPSAPATATLAADGLARGIYGPATLSAPANGGVTITLGSYALRGVVGIPVVTPSGNAFTSGALYLGGLNGLSPMTGGLAYISNLPSPLTGTLTVVDDAGPLGSITFAVNTANSGIGVQSNFVFDSAPTSGWYGQSTPGTACIGPSAQGPNAFGTTGAITVSDPAGECTLADNYGNFSTTPGAALDTRYGLYPITLKDAGSTSSATMFGILAETAPQIDIVMTGQVYTSAQVGDQIAQVRAYSDVGIPLGGLSIASPLGNVGIDNTGKVTLTAAAGSGAGQGFTVTARSATGKPATKAASYAVLPGTLLPASTATVSLVPGLRNSMAGVAVATIAIPGMTAPAFKVSVPTDSCQTLTSYPSNAPQPRYSVTAAGNVATLAAAYLSAQTDQVVLDAAENGNRCIVTVPITATQKVGPTVTIDPAATADGVSVFNSHDALNSAIQNNPSQYDGFLALVASGDYSGDFKSLTNGHGSQHQNWGVPGTFQGSQWPNALTTVDMKGNSNGSGKGIYYQNSVDLTVIGIRVRRTSNAGSAGRPNSAGFYMEAQSPGNLTLVGCIGDTSDNGFLDGDDGKHLSITGSCFAMNGLGDAGYTHNIYCGKNDRLTLSQSLLFGQVHGNNLKSRAYRTHLQDVALIDGEDGGSATFDAPNGGIVTNGGYLLQVKGPNPDTENTNMLQYAAESIFYNGIRSVHDNSLALTGGIMVNALPPWALPVTVIANSGSINPYTGGSNTTTYSGVQFYNVPQARRSVGEYNGSGPATDTGGNTTVTTWPVDLTLDTIASLISLPAAVVASLKALPPGPAYTNPANPSFSTPALLLAPLVWQLRQPLGTTGPVTNGLLTGYDKTGAPLGNPTFTITNTTANAGDYTVTPVTGADGTTRGQINAVNLRPDGLDWIAVSCTGTASDGTSLTVASTKFIVVGQGTRTSS